MRISDRKPLPFGALANMATIASLIACYATRIQIWIPALREPIDNWVNIHLQAAIIVAAAGAAVVGLALDRRHHQSMLPLAAGVAGFGLIAWSMYAPFGRIEDTVGFVVLVTAVFLNQTRALRQLTMSLQSQRTEIEQQNRLLERQSRELAQWNQTLAQRVTEQVSHIERLGRLKRFFSPLDQASLDGLEDSFVVEPIGPLQLKGFQRPVRVAHVVHIKATTTQGYRA